MSIFQSERNRTEESSVDRIRYYVARLEAWLSACEIEIVLFDLDDTLVATEPLFTSRFDHCVRVILKARPQLASVEVTEALKAINVDSFQRMGANLDRRWPYVVDELSARFSLKSRAVREVLLSTLGSIYDELPKLKRGAKKLIEALSQCSPKVGLVTHANREWTDFKLDGLDIRRFFTRVFIVDENSFKTEVSWSDAINCFGVFPEHVLVVGDNLRGDIVAARAIGVQKLVWLRSAATWGHYQEGEIPEGVTIVGDINEFLVTVTQGWQ